MKPTLEIHPRSLVKQVLDHHDAQDEMIRILKSTFSYMTLGQITGKATITPAATLSALRALVSDEVITRKGNCYFLPFQNR